MSDVSRETPAADRGIAMRVGMSGGDDGSMIEMTAIVEAWADRPVIDAMLDKLAGAARRQRAISQLPALRAERDETQKMLDENMLRLAEMDAGHAAAAESRNANIGRLMAQRTEIYQAAYAEHQEAGKRVEFSDKEIRGASKLRHQRFGEQIAILNTNQHKSDEDHQVARSQLDNEVKRRTTSVQILDRRIAECEALEAGDVANGSADLPNRA